MNVNDLIAEILVRTDGTPEGTQVLLNGERLDFWRVTIKIEHGGINIDRTTRVQICNEGP